MGSLFAGAAPVTCETLRPRLSSKWTRELEGELLKIRSEIVRTRLGPGRRVAAGCVVAVKGRHVAA